MVSMDMDHDRDDEKPSGRPTYAGHQNTQNIQKGQSQKAQPHPDGALLMSSNHFSVDPFSDPSAFIPSVGNALLATALFRCWHILLFFSAWATVITYIDRNVHHLAIQSTLLTVLGTVLGFVISYRTTSSFERYNEGRKYWSQIVLCSRTLARAVWLQIPELPPAYPGDAHLSDEQRKARVLVEKKTVINLIEAFAVAVKHYLRGEEGIHYEDLYHLVKFLPSYALPAGLPTNGNHTQDRRDVVSSPDGDVDGDVDEKQEREQEPEPATSTSVEIEISALETNNVSRRSNSGEHDLNGATEDGQHLPLPNTTSKSPTKGSARRGRASFLLPPSKSSTLVSNHRSDYPSNLPMSPSAASARSHFSSRSTRSHQSHRSNKNTKNAARLSTGPDADSFDLLPARLPPRYSLFDLFPFSLLVKILTKGGKELKGKKAARYRARLKNTGRGVVTHNVPLEICVYMTSYVAALVTRKSIDAPTSSLLTSQINSFTDALTGLERILTTPIPFSYSIHLWIVTMIYCLALPFQTLQPLGWLTVPGTAIASFVFFGFIVAGEEIENPFGYDKNDLNMDHFTHNIIRTELLAITSRPPPNPADWAFSPLNDSLFAAHMGGHAGGSQHEHEREDGGQGGEKEREMEEGGEGRRERENLKERNMSPDEWVSRGVDEMQATMADF